LFFQKDPKEQLFDDFLYSVGFGQGIINKMGNGEKLNLNQDYGNQSGNFGSKESFDLNKLMLPKQENYMIYIGQS